MIKVSFILLLIFSNFISSSQPLNNDDLNFISNTIKNRKIILFDDLISNVNRAKESGFSAIHANHPSGGLPDDVVEQIEMIFNS